MALGVRYRLSDNMILGIYGGSDPVALQSYANSGTEGFLAIAPTHPILIEQEKWCVASGGTLAPRTPVQLTPSVTQFTANGIATCTITATGFLTPIPIWIRPPGMFLTITASDNAVVLTSDVPKLFTIALGPEPSHWADPIVVEAV